MSTETPRATSYEMLIAHSPQMPDQPATVEELRERLALGTPFDEAARAYLMTTGTSAYMDLVGDLYWDTLDNCTPEYEEGEGKASILVPNMVAAHQEYGHIGRTLEQYVAEARGEHMRRFMLFCNWPEGADTKRVEQTLETVADFQKKHHEVPISFCARELSAGTAIGTILKMTVDTMLLGVRYSERLDDIMIAAHGADIVRLSPNHLDTLYTAFSAPGTDPMIAVKPRVLRERSNGKFPNLDSVVAWSDLHSERTRSALELGVGMSTRGWMMANGPQVDRRLGELHNLLYRIAPKGQQVMRMPKLVKGTELITSGRREWTHIAEGGSPRTFWEGDMQMSEHYRELEVTQDIDHEARDKAIIKIVAGDGPSFLAYEMQRLKEMGYERKERSERVKRLIGFANALLGSGLHEGPWPRVMDDMIQLQEKKWS